MNKLSSAWTWICDRPLYWSSAILVIYFLPFIVAGENSNITVHDNLDSNVVQYIVLDQQDRMFSGPNAIVNTIMSGQPRVVMVTGLSGQAVLFDLFPPFAAYLINMMLVHVVAFVGMFLLLRIHFLTDPGQKGLAAFVSIAFALIPFYSIYGLSVSGTPLVMLALLNLRRGWHIRPSLIITGLYPFYSSLVFVGAFIIAIALIFLLYMYNKRVPLRNYIIGIALLTVGYIISQYQLFYQFITGSFVSHRSEIVAQVIDFATVVDDALTFFYTLHYHAGHPVLYICWLASVAVIFGVLQKSSFLPGLLVLLGVNLAFAFLRSLANWELLAPVWEILPITNMFQWNRFYILSPLVWFLSLAFSLVIIREAIRPVTQPGPVIFVICCLQLYTAWKYNVDFRETCYNLFSEKDIGWSFNGFFAPQLFDKIKKHIDKPIDSYTVGSVGMHPTVAQANGFRTVDGYLANYPLSYKQEFRKIIAKELDRSPGLKHYFDDWGSRCYLFSSETGYNFLIPKDAFMSIDRLDYDFSQGPVVDYIFSPAEIRNETASGLSLMSSFESDGSRWKIYLYKVRESYRMTAENSVEISIRLQAAIDDMIELYYVPAGAQSFSEDHSLRVGFSGKAQFQKISFRLPDSVDVRRLRLDLGTTPSQQTVTIQKMMFGRRQTNTEVVIDHFDTNQFIERDDNRFNLKPVDGRYDPYFEFDQESIEAYNHVRTHK